MKNKWSELGRILKQKRFNRLNSALKLEPDKVKFILTF